MKDSIRAVKGQVAGPFTLLAGLKDGGDRALLYDERFQDVLPKHLAMNAAWQVRLLSRASGGKPVILFMDEPALAGFGSSAFISVTMELVGQLLGEVVDSVHREGGLAGIHVCANTDWLIAFRSGIDIINFDAGNYFDKFALYRDEFHAFIERGGIVAWGMVPTDDPALLDGITARGLADAWLRDIEPLVSPRVSMSKILEQSLFTPGCGCGSLPVVAAERVVRLTRELSEIMKKYL